MKKIILTIAVVAFAASVSAQDFSYGLKGGLNLATFTNDSEAKLKPSIYIGGFAEWRLGDVLAISPELYYSRQGAAANMQGLKVKSRLNYLNLPVLAKLYLTDALSLDLGPQIGFLINSVAWAKANGNTGTTKMKGVNSVDVSFPVGLTFNFGNYLVQGRYNIGLTQINDDDPDKSKNSVIQLGVGYRF